jgi:hypothetical protein
MIETRYGRCLRALADFLHSSSLVDGGPYSNTRPVKRPLLFNGNLYMIGYHPWSEYRNSCGRADMFEIYDRHDPWILPTEW